MASLMYGAGLRLMECLRPRVQDIDFSRHEILVHDGKGARDRITLFPASLIVPLRDHLVIVKHLLEGGYDIRTVQELLGHPTPSEHVPSNLTPPTKMKRSSSTFRWRVIRALDTLFRDLGGSAQTLVRLLNDAMLPENLTSLHEHEERIRIDSFGLIEKNPSLREHLSMIHCAMAIIYALAHDHINASDDELTVQYLGLRLFNSAASSLKLSLSGYYQAAFALVRDIFETVALLDYLGSHPDQIAVWKGSDKNRRISRFGPAAIRKALNERDPFSGNRRKEVYDRLSEYASHATAPGFQLLAPEGLGQIGPFLSEKYLKAWLEEAVKFLVHGGTIFKGHFAKVGPPLLLEKADFLKQATHWRKRYLASSDGPKAT